MLFVFLLAFVLGAAEPRAQDWEHITTYDRVDGYLGDQKPEPSSYPNAEHYDQARYRFRSVWGLQLTAGTALVAEVWSPDFLPLLVAQDWNQQELLRGISLPAQVDQASGVPLFGGRIELHAPWNGPAELVVTSEDVGQGRFQLYWSLWRPKGSAPPPSPSGGGGGSTPFPDCDCQDPASGRYYESHLGVCDPALAVKWCN